MRTVSYEDQEKGTGGTDNHIAVDEAMEKKYGNLQRAYVEGFAASDGVRGETAETDGEIEHPETGDDARPGRKLDSVEKENSGLADS